MRVSLDVRQQQKVFQSPVQNSCTFCNYLSGKTPCAFVTRGPEISTFMNRAQYENGAVLLVPNRHIENILDLDTDLMLSLYKEAQRLAHAFIDAFGAVGLNMFQNNGIQAGQTIAHCHTHLVPRYPGSDSSRIFREEDYPITPLEELHSLADRLKLALPHDAV